MTLVNCLSCGRKTGELLASGLRCQHCGYEWSYADESRMAGYISRVFRRHPAIPPVVETTAELDTIPLPRIDDLTQIEGIGKATARKLADLGIATLTALAGVEDVDSLAYAIRGVTVEDVESWKTQAEALINA